LAIFRTTRKAFLQGRWRKRPSSDIKLKPGFAPSIDPEADLPGVRRNAASAPATGNRPDTLHSRCSSHPQHEDNKVSNVGTQRRVGGGVRTRSNYSRPQGKTVNLSSQPPAPPKKVDPYVEALEEAVSNGLARISQLEGQIAKLTS